MGFFIMDFDGTLANIEHRAHYVRDGNRQWDKFFDECDKDLPEKEVIAVLRALCDAGHRVEIWSGRSDAVREKSEDWLDKHVGHVLDRNGDNFVPASSLLKRMRPHNDFQSDVELKRSWLHEEETKPDMIFDDRQGVVDMWREEGIKCSQVEPGDFDEPKAPARPRKPTLKVMIGPSGAGKSTYIQKRFAGPGVVVLSSDEIRMAQFATADDFAAAAYCPAGFKATFSALHGIAKAHLDGGLDVIVDSTNLKRRDRMSLLKAVGADTGDVNVEYYIIDRPLQEKLDSYNGSWHTNCDVIKRHHKTFAASKRDALNGDGLPFVAVTDLTK
jgi:predicted kinase